MKYYANFNANNGTHLAKDIIDTNKKRIIQTISQIANENRFDNNTCCWNVYDERGKNVAAGYTLPNGQRCRIPDNDLQYFNAD